MNHFTTEYLFWNIKNYYFYSNMKKVILSIQLGLHDLHDLEYNPSPLLQPNQGAK